MSLKIAVTGAAGRMGQQVIAASRAWDAKATIIGVDLNEPQSVDQWLSFKELPQVDLIIDFSQPRLMRELLAYCRDHTPAIVSGTTGLSASDQKNFDKLAATHRILWAPNMSFGVAIVKQMLTSLGLMPDADFFIEDYHHRHKVDAPSGTAKDLLSTLESATGRKKIPVTDQRAGGIYGIHTINAVTEEEMITVSHTALNRAVFAKGAVRAADWLLKQEPGRYKIEDVLGL